MRTIIKEKFKIQNSKFKIQNSKFKIKADAPIIFPKILDTTNICTVYISYIVNIFDVITNRRPILNFEF